MSGFGLQSTRFVALTIALGVATGMMVYPSKPASAGELMLALSLYDGGEASKPVPKWKLEHQARIQNAAKVCGNPTVASQADPQNLTNGFYTINLIAGLSPRFITLDDNADVAFDTSYDGEPTEWLLSRVGSGLYQLASCYEGQAACLYAKADRTLEVAICDTTGLSDQVWWMKGIIGGPEDGGWYLGSDTFGFDQCLTFDYERGIAVIAECLESHTAWRFTRKENP